MPENELSKIVFDLGMKVHKSLGPNPFASFAKTLRLCVKTKKHNVITSKKINNILQKMHYTLDKSNIFNFYLGKKHIFS